MFTPTAETLDHIFRRTAARFPERVAVDAPPTATRPARVRLTYAALAGWADRIVAVLSPLVYPDAVVAILLPRDAADVYAAQLGVLSAGAAYAPVDPSAPDEFLRRVLADAQPVAVLTDRAGRQRLESLDGPDRFRVFDTADLPTAGSEEGGSTSAEHRPPHTSPLEGEVGRGREATRPGGGCSSSLAHDGLAYVIYTSGTTGTPKGVLIAHRGVVNLVTENVGHFALSPDDRVAQCSSPAYDSSVEETWLAFAAGATLVPIDDLTLRSGPDLVPWLRRERVSVLCPPPTLLRSCWCDDPAAALPELRVLYVGGEPLPQDIADRWAAGRVMVNGYGPTECTVTVIRAEVRPGCPVTIGRPVPGNHAWVVDPITLDVLPDGQTGELVIGGVGLARGYHARPELTAAKFIRHERLGRVYRTGDLARRNAAGEFEHHGRLDGQVKLRGQRVELPAIEAVLAEVPGVRAAACRVQGADGAEVLAAHIVSANGHRPPVDHLKDAVRRALPAYMVPSLFAFTDRLPTQIGGKLDRRALPDIPPPGHDHDVPKRPDAPSDAVLSAVCAGMCVALGLPDCPPESDFFHDLGGDSLSAVRVVVEVRRSRPDLAVAVRDLYEARTAAALAARLRPAGPTLPAPSPVPPPVRYPAAVTLAQAAFLAAGLILAGVVGPAVLALLPVLVDWCGLSGTVAVTAGLWALAGVAAGPLAVLATVLAKWVLICRYVPMTVPVWGGFYLRHWVVTRFARLIPWGLVAGTAAQAVILRLLGARVGRRVHLNPGVNVRDGGWDLLDLGDGATVAMDAELRTIELTDGRMVLDRVTVGAGGTVGTRAGLSPGSTLGADAELTPLSWLPGGVRAGDGELWDGVPARPVGTAPEPGEPTEREWHPAVHAGVIMAARLGRRLVSWLPIAFVAWAAEQVVPQTAAAVTQWLVEPAWDWWPLVALVMLSVVAVPVSLAMQAVFARALGRIRSGCYPLRGLTAVRVDAVIGTVDAASEWLSGSVLWPLWLRAAGMRIGRGCEISTVIDVVPGCVRIGTDSFFADGIYLAGPVRRRGTLTVEQTSLGRNTFIGNHAVIPPGHIWPDDLFIGVATVADPQFARSGTDWFGHPPLELPRRETVAADRHLTHDPPLVRRVNRYFWEWLRFALPVLPVAVGYGYFIAVSSAVAVGSGWLEAVVVGTAAVAAAAATPCAAVVGLKWLLLGRTRAGEHPLWSCWCSRWDFLYVAWGYWARDLLSALDGTLLLNAYLRLVGVRIGRRVVLGDGFAHVVDPDMLVIDDDATVTAHFQAHSFEDRVLKTEPLRVRRGATVGPNAIVFYGADVGEGAEVWPHAVVMKRDVVGNGVTYSGCPGQPVARAVTRSRP
jgi:non-ribosomal peptide synthetase-like protein